MKRCLAILISILIFSVFSEQDANATQGNLHSNPFTLDTLALNSFLGKTLKYYLQSTEYKHFIHKFNNEPGSLLRNITFYYRQNDTFDIQIIIAIDSMNPVKRINLNHYWSIEDLEQELITGIWLIKQTSLSKKGLTILKTRLKIAEIKEHEPDVFEFIVNMLKKRDALNEIEK